MFWLIGTYSHTYSSSFALFHNKVFVVKVFVFKVFVVKVFVVKVFVVKRICC